MLSHPLLTQNAALASQMAGSFDSPIALLVCLINLFLGRGSALLERTEQALGEVLCHISKFVIIAPRCIAHGTLEALYCALCQITELVCTHQDRR
jgi:hypothetical protein